MEGLLLPLLLMLVVAVPLVLGTRKQKKQVQQQQNLQKSLVVGDRVMTTSGMYATVIDVSDETTIDLEIAEGIVTTWLRQAVREKVHPEADELDEEATENSETEVAEDGEPETDSAREHEVTTGASLETDKK